MMNRVSNMYILLLLLPLEGHFAVFSRKAKSTLPLSLGHRSSSKSERHLVLHPFASHAIKEYRLVTCFVCTLQHGVAKM